MTSEFEERLSNRIRPILDEVASKELDRKRKKEAAAREEKRRREAQAANSLKADAFVEDCMTPIADSIAAHLEGKILRDDHHYSGPNMRAVAVNQKFGTEFEQRNSYCYISLGISCSADAFIVTVSATVQDATKFLRNETFSASEFTHDQALNWLEANAIDATEYVATNNRPDSET